MRKRINMSMLQKIKSAFVYVPVLTWMIFMLSNWVVVNSYGETTNQNHDMEILMGMIGLNEEEKTALRAELATDSSGKQKAADLISLTYHNLKSSVELNEYTKFRTVSQALEDSTRGAIKIVLRTQIDNETLNKGVVAQTVSKIMAWIQKMVLYLKDLTNKDRYIEVFIKGKITYASTSSIPKSSDEKKFQVTGGTIKGHNIKAEEIKNFTEAYWKERNDEFQINISKIIQKTYTNPNDLVDDLGIVATTKKFAVDFRFKQPSATFITPLGQPINLPAGYEILPFCNQDYNAGGVTNGSLLSFSIKDGFSKTYRAKFRQSSGGLYFEGYFDDLNPKPWDYTKYLSKSKTVHVVEGSDPDSKGYYKKYVIYATQVTNINTTTETSGKVVDFKYTQQPNKGIIYPNNLNNCDGNTDNDQDVTVGETKFKLSTDAKGNITVESTWKKSTKCSSCDEKAEEILQQTLSKARQASGGKLTEKSIIVVKTKKDFGKLGNLDYADVDLKTFLKNLATMYNSLLDKAQVPTEVWQEGKTFSVRDGTSGVISGVLDGVGEQYKDIAELIGLGLNLVANPEQTATSFKSFIADLDLSKIGSLSKAIGQGVIGYDEGEFKKGGNYTYHATGKLGVGLSVLAMTGATGVMAIIKETPEQLRKSLKLKGFFNKSLVEKIKEVNDIWKTKYPLEEFFEGRTFFEDVMGQYRYTKSTGWNHTSSIADNFKGVDFYKGSVVGNQIFANTAVSMKTTITTNVDTWLASAPIKKNIQFIEEGLNPAIGLSSNGKTMVITNAEIHIYMPKANITDALKTTWMNKLNTVNQKIKFEIKVLEDFIQ
jgi:hypothetical protein